MKEKKEERKLRGGYYTPKKMADFISNWVIQNKEDKVLEPSCGEGEFIESMIERFMKLNANKKQVSSNILGIEINPTESKKSIKKFDKHGISAKKESIITGDYFKHCKKWLNNNKSFNGIVGNPPFIRYQDFNDEQKIPALGLMKRAGLKPNKLINAWIPFLIGSTLLLKSKGRLGMVLPAELFQVNYAAETRKFLSEFYSRIFIITFKKLVFKGIQQEVIIFLGEKNGRENHGINIIQVNDLDDLDDIDFNKVGKDIKNLNHSTEKWTQYFLNKKENDLLRKVKNNPSLPSSGEYIGVDVGIVTGQNKYFILNKDQVKEYNLEKEVIKIFGRSNQVGGLIASKSDWNELEKDSAQCYLLSSDNKEYSKLPKGLKKYVDYGEAQEVNTGYKCRIRKNWWVVPSIWTPEAFMLRQVHKYPKLIYNKSGATVTDTLHRVKFLNGIKKEFVVAAFLNSLTLAFSEITGRSYGGGVLTFEPSEAEQLPLPMKGAEKLDIKKLDNLIRENKIDEVLDITDKILLRDGLNLSEEEIRSLRKIWVKLRDRRINRKRSK